MYTFVINIADSQLHIANSVYKNLRNIENDIFILRWPTSSMKQMTAEVT